ncbi:flagellar motor protein MotB [Jatrophihabitans sp. DSM 45814]
MSSAARARAGRRRGHEEEHENSERWMVTYADMLTLLLVLFIVLYAISQVNTSKFAELKSGLATAFKNGQPSVLTAGSGIVGGESVSSQQQIVGPNNITIPQTSQQQAQQSSTVPADTTAAQREVDEFARIKAAIQTSLHAHGLDGSALFSVDERGLVVTIVTDELVFAGNSAALENQGKTIMGAVAVPLRTIDNQLQVDGHTNQQNVSTDPYPSGWELSSARASSVVRFLIQNESISASRLSAVGYSDQRPLIPPSDPRSITRNRRVDIVVLSKLPAGSTAQLATLGKALTDTPN